MLFGEHIEESNHRYIAGFGRAKLPHRREKPDPPYSNKTAQEAANLQVRQAADLI
jgi:hypothetical protein